jgi:hypothetical protein
MPTTGMGYTSYQSEEDFNKSLQQAATQASRNQLAQKQADDTNTPISINGNVYLPSSSLGRSSNANGSGGSSGSAGSVNASTGDFLSTAKSAQDLAKDMAQFQLGINAQQGEQDFGFRDREATRTQQFGLENKQVDYTNTYGLQGQQIEGTQTLETTRQGAETGRLAAQLQNQKDMQTAEFLNQTNQRSQAANLAMSGFKR